MHDPLPGFSMGCERLGFSVSSLFQIAKESTQIAL